MMKIESVKEMCALMADQLNFDATGDGFGEKSTLADMLMDIVDYEHKPIEK